MNKVINTRELIRDYQNCLTRQSCRLKEEFRDLLASRKYYITPEICREVGHIDNGLGHLKLGSDLLNRSQSIQHYTEARKIRHEYGSYDAVQKAREKFCDVRDRMNVCKVMEHQDLEVRQAHHYTMKNLIDIQKDMKPYVHNTIHRLNDYCANVGVTDRFQGYRNNINLGVKDPMICPSNVDQNVDEELCPEECCCDCCCPTELDKLPKCPVKSVQEQYGINTCYPGSSEYTDQYKTPARPIFLKYVINPTPNYTRNGRKMAKRVKVPMLTNYSENFTWPDDCKLPHYPWLRK